MTSAPDQHKDYHDTRRRIQAWVSLLQLNSIYSVNSNMLSQENSKKLEPQQPGPTCGKHLKQKPDIMRGDLSA